MPVLSFIFVGLLITAISPLLITAEVSNNTLPKPRICGRSDANRFSSRIAGGMKTALDAYPWTALLGSRTSRDSPEISFFCGGSLISDQFVLTAAHCLYPVDVDKQHVIRLGEWDIESEADCNGNICSDKPIDFDIETYRLHESYDPESTYNDIALMKLPRPVSFTKFISPVCLPLGDELQKQPKVGRILTTIGWGDTENGRETPLYGSRYKKETNISVIDNAACNKQVPWPILSSQFCAKNSTSGQNCSGDSGGPVVTEENDGYWYQYGVVSWGLLCGNRTLSDSEMPLVVYARVSSFLPWIMETMKQLDDTSVSEPAN